MSADPCHDPTTIAGESDADRSSGWMILRHRDPGGRDSGPTALTRGRRAPVHLMTISDIPAVRVVDPGYLTHEIDKFCPTCADRALNRRIQGPDVLENVGYGRGMTRGRPLRPPGAE